MKVVGVNKDTIELYWFDYDGYITWSRLPDESYIVDKYEIEFYVNNEWI